MFIKYERYRHNLYIINENYFSNFNSSVKRGKEFNETSEVINIEYNVEWIKCIHEEIMEQYRDNSCCQF